MRNRSFSFNLAALPYFRRDSATAVRRLLRSDLTVRPGAVMLPFRLTYAMSPPLANGPLVWPTPVVSPTATLRLHTRSFSPTRWCLSCDKSRFAPARTEVCPNPYQMGYDRVEFSCLNFGSAAAEPHQSEL